MTKVYLMLAIKLPNTDYYREYFKESWEGVEVVTSKDYIYAGAVLSCYEGNQVDFTLELISKGTVNYIEKCSEVLANLPYIDPTVVPDLQFFSAES